MKTLEGNRLIAEFMGWESGKYHNLPNKLHKIEDGEEMGIHINQLEYHSSWDWLMPVVDKINKIDNREYDVIIWRSDCHINNREELMFESSMLKQKDTLIGVVWGCIILFIQWYNSQSKTDNNDK